MQINEILKKNLAAMSGIEYGDLKQKLSKITELKNFTYKLGADKLDINLIKKSSLKSIYKNAMKELDESIKKAGEYALLPVLIFYGFGNGVFYKALLQNEKHKKIVIIEPELEVIYIALSFIDFSEAIKKANLIILLSEEVDFAKANRIISLADFQLFMKSYELRLHSDFYKAYEDNIKHINKLFSNAIITTALKRGNDPQDAMQGIFQTVVNLSDLINGLSFNEIKQKLVGKSKTAIVVATGPSLTKQLDTLKKYANKAIIFCADSSYNILKNNGIKPDFVLSLERTSQTSKFFDNDFGEFDKDIIFILPALTHPNTLEFLKKNKRRYAIAPRSLPFSMSLNLHEFGYMGGGMSVSHLAYETAVFMGCKDIILIGQDLSFAKDNTSHPNDYLFGPKYDNFNTFNERYNATAYGGEGVVKSTQVWTLFRNIFEIYIGNNKHSINTYNCTEGGARIEGAIEQPFSKTCESLLSKDLKKPLARVKKLPRTKQNEIMLRTYNLIKKQIKTADNFNKELKKTLRQIQLLTIKNKHIDMNELVARIDKFREKITKNKYSFLLEILGPTLYHEENIISPIYTQKVQNDSQKQNKMLAWIYAHDSIFESVTELIDVQNKLLRRALFPLRQSLEKRKLI